MMHIKLSETAMTQYKSLTTSFKKKVDKQFEHLVQDIRHPSLHAKKYRGSCDLWQARVDSAWRFYFYIIAPDYIIISAIKHPK